MRSILLSIILGGFLLVLQPGTAQAYNQSCEHGICFRFPALEHEQFFAPDDYLWSPFHFDIWPSERKGYCHNYTGQLFPHCYDGHKGTDFILRGGFRSMATDVPVVASATGQIIAIEDTHYDKCRMSALDWLYEQQNPHDTAGTWCGIDPETGEPREPKNNYVVMRHWNGEYYVYSRYLHIKQDSIPNNIYKEFVGAQNAASANGGVEDPEKPFPTVACGETIAFVGSAGKSSLPHIHFDVQVDVDNPTSDPTGMMEKTIRIDPYYGALTPLLYPERSLSMWVNQEPEPYALPSTACDGY